MFLLLFLFRITCHFMDPPILFVLDCGDLSVLKSGLTPMPVYAVL